MRKIWMPALALAALQAPAAAYPQEATEADVLPGTFGGSVAVMSDYVFRGISQTDENPALQGGLEWRHPKGPLAGVWGSNVDFNDGSQASVELDWYAGYADTFRTLAWDARVIYYSYPGADVARDYDYWELAATATLPEAVDGIDLGAGYNFSPDYFAESGAAHYLHLDGGWSPAFLPLAGKVKGTIGRQWIEDNSFFGTPDYWHWSAGLGFTVEKVDLSVTYSDTDIEKRRCGASLDTCGARIVAGAAAAF